MKTADLETSKFRWLALVVLALGLAIVIIDNTVLNVAVPYILRDFNASLDSIEWVISGYALIIATLLITVGRLGDIIGRKKIFKIGLVFFATGSFIASISQSMTVLFIGEALIEAIGAAMMLTSSLSLIASEFQDRERAIAFGIWGAVAGGAASLGPLLGGYFTTYHSWRWSLLINVFVAIVALIGTIFIKEAKGENGKRFDFLGTLLSGVGLFSLMFALIEGQKFGWWYVNQPLYIGSWHWPFIQISVIPFFFLTAIIFLALFIYWEDKICKLGGSPLVKLSMFKNKGLAIALTTVTVLSLGQFGVFFVLPIYMQNVLGRDAFHTGLLALIASITVFIVGPITGVIAARYSPKWIVTAGMFIFSAGVFLLSRTIAIDSNGWTLAPALILLGFGIGMSSAQITNIILSSTPLVYAGEVSAVNATLRQVGTSVGIAILGAVMVSVISSEIVINIKNDSNVPVSIKANVEQMISIASVENGQALNFINSKLPKQISTSIALDIKNTLISSSKKALNVAFAFVLLGAFISIFIPRTKTVSELSVNITDKECNNKK